MDGVAWILALGSIAGGVASATADAAGRPRLSAVLKMAAATGYLLLGLRLDATATPYGRLLLIAFSLSWVGDLFLTSRRPSRFAAGLASFLLAHLVYTGAFMVRGAALIPALGGALGMAAVAVVVWRWLVAAELPGRLRRPVALYLVAITLMVAFAVGTAWPLPGIRAVPGRQAGVLVLAGALAFAGSDILVARHRFVTEAAVNRLVGLPLYMLAQLLLAGSLA